MRLACASAWPARANLRLSADAVGAAHGAAVDGRPPGRPPAEAAARGPALIRK